MDPVMNETAADDASCWSIAGATLRSRLFLGTAGYPSPDVLHEALRVAHPGAVTVGLRRVTAGGVATDNGFLRSLRDAAASSGARLLPNTAGCRTADEAVALAHLAAELFDTRWIKLEVVGDEHTLQPDPWELLAAAERLARDGFDVFPYCTDDLVLGRRLLEAGCVALMPWAAPIGSGQGLLDPFALRTLRARLPDARLIVDAGLGAPSHAVAALELGIDAVLLNSAVAQAGDPVRMAGAFALAVRAGRLAHGAGLMAPQAMAVPTTPVGGRPFLVGEGA
jgi:thiazole synthase